MEDRILNPIYTTTWKFYAFTIALLIIIGWFAYAWWVQLTRGLIVTGLRDFGVGAGAPWGVYIVSFIWYVGIAHGGIAISAAIRLMKLKEYKPVARVAEVMTVISLLMAGLSITFDLGRPDRIFNMIVHYWSRVGYSPLIWDLTVVITYLVLSITYLVITMREDIAVLKTKLPRRFNIFYKFILVGYAKGEKEKVEQMAWWLALSLIVLMALLSGGVIPWLFGLMVSQPGWFSAVQGPYFLSAALASAIAGVIVLAAVVRYVFKLEEVMKPEIFGGLSKVLAIAIPVYLWFVLHEQLTAQYAGPIAEKTISDSLLFGNFSTTYWLVILGLALSFVYLFLQSVKAIPFSMNGTFVASLIVAVVLWWKRFLIIVPTFIYPRLPYPVGSYTPTWVEWSLLAGMVALSTLLFTLFVKVYPLMELERGD